MTTVPATAFPTTASCPACGSGDLYTGGVTTEGVHQRVEWMLDADGRVLARWRSEGGVQHEVLLRRQDVFCSECNTRLGGPSLLHSIKPFVPWPRMAVPGG